MADRSHIALADQDKSVLLAWSMPGHPVGFIRFKKATGWCDLIERLGIDVRIPDIVRAKFARAQTPYIQGRIDFSVLKTGELASLIALELAVIDPYGWRVSKSKRSFAALLKHMVDANGLTDAQSPIVARCGGTAVGRLTGKTRPTLAERRNTLAHGAPFEGLPTGGLLELVQDLINFAYRHYMAEAASLDAPASAGRA